MTATSKGRSHQPSTSTIGLPVTFTLFTTLNRALADPLHASGAEVLEALESCAPKPATTVRCLNPICSEPCHWTESSGRPKKFCSDTCRQQHEKTRKRLECELAILDGALGHPDTTPKQKKLLVSQRAHRVFELARYPDVRGPRSKSSFIMPRHTK